MIRLFTLFILSWILTVVVEGGAARLFFSIEKKEQILLLLVNTVTNPLAVLLSLMLPAYTRIPFNAAVLAAEALAFCFRGVPVPEMYDMAGKRVRPMENCACSECDFIWHRVSYIDAAVKRRKGYEEST